VNRAMHTPRPYGSTHDGVDDVLLRTLESYIPDVLKVTRTPGLCIAIGHRGRVIWEGAFGFADLRAKRPMTPTTVAHAGSHAKLYTATAVLQLAERGVFDLHEPINRHLKDLEVVNPLGDRPVTAYDLLTFQSGLGVDTIDGHLEKPPPLKRYIRRELARNTRREYHGADVDGARVHRWQSRVGERYQYSNFGVAILGLLVADANPEGLSLCDYVTRNIFRPLGMRSTWLPPDEEPDRLPAHLQERLATGYASFGDTHVETPTIQTPCSPATGLVTTAADQVRWMNAMLNSGEAAGERVLKKSTVDLMLTPHVALSDPTLDEHRWNGLVVVLSDPKGDSQFFGEVGAHPWGWWADSRAYPEHDLAVTVLANRWTMPRWFQPTSTTAHGLVHRLITDVVRGEGASTRRHGPGVYQQTYSWRRSYVMGAILAERCLGLLGNGDGLSLERVQRLADSARRSSGDSPSNWDRQAFVEGVNDMSRRKLTAREVQRRVTSGGTALDPAQLRLVGLEMTGRAEVPIPMAFYARAQPPHWPVP
jgi:CubicO group peptidase (beta-lactamase class C family)